MRIIAKPGIQTGETMIQHVRPSLTSLSRNSGIAAIHGRRRFNLTAVGPQREKRMTRKATNRLLELIEEGLVDRDYVILACVKYMSEDAVADMCHDNEIVLFEEEE
jgi:hypothetical protein